MPALRHLEATHMEAMCAQRVRLVKLSPHNPTRLSFVEDEKSNCILIAHRGSPIKPFRFR